MRMIVPGGDARMDGAADAARKKGWDVLRTDELPDGDGGAYDAALLPWPRSFENGKLTGTQIDQRQMTAWLSPVRMVMYGGAATAQQPPAGWVNPGTDEAFLRENAALTAEGAVCCAMQRDGRALLHETCMITGFGRIAQALASRLAAFGAFVIVCARSEAQMRLAHDLGAHPMTLERIREAAAQADVIFNTVPARVLGQEALEAMKKDALLIELASPPYGADPALCAELGVERALLGGVPGRYAPSAAGAALFRAFERAWLRAGHAEKGGAADG